MHRCPIAYWLKGLVCYFHDFLTNQADEEIGRDTGIIPLVDSSALGKTTTAWIRISLDTKVDCCEFAKEIAKRADVMEVHEVAGELDRMGYSDKG